VKPISVADRRLDISGNSASSAERADKRIADSKPSVTLEFICADQALLGSQHRNLHHVGSFSAELSTGIFRSRLPVAAKIALATAGTMAEVPHSPIPPGGSEL
jgi:hypothetical protein